MAKYEVIFADGRVTRVNSDSGEAQVARQAEHWDKDRFVINVKRNQEPGPTPSTAAVIRKLED